jgi:hypothetical protein
MIVLGYRGKSLLPKVYIAERFAGAQVIVNPPKKCRGWHLTLGILYTTATVDQTYVTKLDIQVEPCASYIVCAEIVIPARSEITAHLWIQVLSAQSFAPVGPYGGSVT